MNGSNNLVRALWYRLQVLPVYLLLSLACVVPRKLALGLARLFPPIFLSYFAKDYSRCRGQLHKFLGFSKIKSRRFAFRVFTHTLQTLIDLVYLSPLSNDEFFRVVTIEGEEHIHEAYSQGRGVVLLAAHLGHWELVGSVISRLGYPVTAIGRKQDNPLLESALFSLRRQGGVKIIYSDNISSGMNCLRQGDFLGVVADQNTREKGEAIPFFGKMSSTTAAPFLLQRRTRAPILPVRCIRNSDFSYTLKVEPIFIPEKGENIKESKYLTLVKMNRLFESWIREDPAQWVWFHRRWPKKEDRYF